KSPEGPDARFRHGPVYRQGSGPGSQGRNLGGRTARRRRSILNQLAGSKGGLHVSTGNILIVDDEPQIRRVLRTTLTAQGYQVADARSGEEALECVRKDHFDLILLDLNMPGMGGLDACRELRARSD